MLSWTPLSYAHFCCLFWFLDSRDFHLLREWRPSTSTQNSASFFFLPRNCWNPENCTPPPKGVILLLSLPAAPIRILFIEEARVPLGPDLLLSGRKFLERREREKSCLSRGSVILQLLIIPVEAAALEGCPAAEPVCVSVCSCAMCTCSSPIGNVRTGPSGG